MAIADRINEMYTHVGDVYDTITNVDLPTNKNIQNIPSTMRSSYLEIMNNGIDKIWDNWEKVTGSGTDISLSPTLEAPMKNVLNGNTYQFTTTGKNKLDTTEYTSKSVTGITITPNYEGDMLKNIKVSGTPTATNWINMKNVTFEPGTYIISGLNVTQSGKTGLRIGLYFDSARQYFINVNSPTYTFTLTETATAQFVIWVQSVADFPTTDTYITPMIRLSSVTDSTYEPYTGGQASPNPQYPQDIHVVSGDNNIKVEGRNLLNANFDTNTSNGITQNGYNNVITLNGANTSAHGYTFPESITFEKGVAYTTHVKIIGGTFTPYKSGSNWAVQFYSLYGSNAITLTSNNYNSVFHFTPSETSKVFPRLWFGWESASVQGTDGVFSNLKIQVDVVKGTYTTSQMENIEPYNSNIYSINLPVENKFDDSTTTNILIADDGTEQTNNNIKTSIYIKVEPNTLYTCSSKLLPDKTSGWLKFSYYDVNKNYLSYLYTDNTIRTITTPNNCEYIRIGYHTSIVNDVQFEVGSKANSYTPYGTTPIELCDINTYKDNFLRTSGKNLFDKDNTNIVNAFINPTGYVLQANDNMRTLYIPCKPNTTYTVSKIQSARFVLGTSNTTAIGSSMTNGRNNFTATQLTITSGANDTYLFVFYYNGNADTLTPQQILDTIQIEEGTTATVYEPYGSGEWYTHKELGKAIIDENIVGGALTDSNQRIMFSSSSNPFLSNVYISTPSSASNLTPSLSNYFSSSAQSEITPTNNKVGFSKWGDTTFVYFSAIYNSVADFKTWLSTHNVVVYFVLATPTYTKITDTTLLEQLEAFYNAKSKNSQTNITQENNDLPFIIDSTMLKEV